LIINNPEAKQFIEKAVLNIPDDKRFVYYLMAATGICVVPLSGFNSHLKGFRMTLLEPDENKFKKIVETISRAIKEYLS